MERKVVREHKEFRVLQVDLKGRKELRVIRDFKVKLVLREIKGFRE
jgi:hypothetical protein